jgi:hypothetical protein
VAVHLVNYDHDDDADGVRRTGEVDLSVRLAGLPEVARAVLHRAEASPAELAVERAGDLCRVTLPDVGVYAVVELRGAAS